MQKKISIIIPVFNGEKFLEKCISSILSQSMRIDEIIIINDNSYDDTKKILNHIYSEVENIIIVNLEENCGVSYCRNLGLDLSSGDYIGFVDIDDFIEVNMYEKMYKKAVNNDLDICICNFSEIDGLNKIKSKYKNDNEIINRDEAIRKYLLNQISPSVWDKIFKREILENLKFNNELKIGEDILFCLEAISHGKKIGFVNDTLYNYVQHSNSAVHTISKNLLQYKEVVNYISNDTKLNLNTYYKNEYESFFNTLNLRIIHSISALCNKNTKEKVFQYLSSIDKKYLIAIVKDQNLNKDVKIETLIILIFGYKIHIFLQPLYRKIRNMKYR